MALLTRNTKMRKATLKIYNFTLPAFLSQNGTKICPNAGQCAKWCYAKQGTYNFSNVKRKHESNFEATRQNDFINRIVSEISTKRRIDAVRIHDAGDFYSLEYLYKWLTLAKLHENIIFYAYTKQIRMFKSLRNSLPENFIIIYSFGGKQDHMIDANKDRHSKVFESMNDLIAAGYIDTTTDDSNAFYKDNFKIGLVYHGHKSKFKTKQNNYKKVG